MWGKYSIQQLPSLNNIVHIDAPAKKERNYMKIKENTFSCTALPLRVRPKAVEFAKRFFMQGIPVYAVIFQDEEYTECLYFFSYQHLTNGKFILHYIRCIGANTVNAHKYVVLGRIEDKKWKQQIEALSETEELSFKTCF